MVIHGVGVILLKIERIDTPCKSQICGEQTLQTYLTMDVAIVG